MADILYFVITILLSTIISAFLGYKIIPILKKKKMEQPILQFGDNWHEDKKGTPTMGGIFFIIPTFLSFIAYIVFSLMNDTFSFKVLAVFVLAFLFGIAGIIDDYKKLIKKENEGLKEKSKLLLQIISVVIFFLILFFTNEIDTVIELPILNKSIDLGIFYYIVMGLIIVGLDNAVNFTDGLDGLCSFVTLIISTFFAILSFSIETIDLNNIYVAAPVIGGLIGFLIFNFHPAKVFMGDTGSLFLGGIVCGYAILSGYEFIVLLAGIIYIIELASVIIQRTYFKLTKKFSKDKVGKRIFPKTPIHHSFELKGMKENKIVFLFSLVTLIFSVISYLVIKF